MFDDAYKLIESLHAKLFKSRAETQKALGEKEKAESECIHAKLKLNQMQAHLDNAQEALNARAQDRRAREVQGAFDQADQEYRVRTAKAEITARLLSRSHGIRANHPFNLTVDIFYFDQCCAKNPSRTGA